MNRNVEIKARVADFDALKKRVSRLAGCGPEVLFQDDTFFHSGSGRLKLRKLSDTEGELIFYERPDREEPVESSYAIASTSRPGDLLDVLSRSMGVRGIVRKKRLLYSVGQTRIHLDRVQGLGEFVEIEVVLRPDQDCAEGVRIARELMGDLGIAGDELVPGAYVDLLEEGSRG